MHLAFARPLRARVARCGAVGYRWGSGSGGGGGGSSSGSSGGGSSSSSSSGGGDSKGSAPTSTRRRRHRRVRAGSSTLREPASSGIDQGILSDSTDVLRQLRRLEALQQSLPSQSDLTAQVAALGQSSQMTLQRQAVAMFRLYRSAGVGEPASELYSQAVLASARGESNEAAVQLLQEMADASVQPQAAVPRTLLNACASKAQMGLLRQAMDLCGGAQKLDARGMEQLYLSIRRSKDPAVFRELRGVLEGRRPDSLAHDLFWLRTACKSWRPELFEVLLEEAGQHRQGVFAGAAGAAADDGAGTPGEGSAARMVPFRELDDAATAAAAAREAAIKGDLLVPCIASPGSPLRPAAAVAASTRELGLDPAFAMDLILSLAEARVGEEEEEEKMLRDAPASPHSSLDVMACAAPHVPAVCLV